MKKYKTIDDQIWSDVDHAERSRENKKVVRNDVGAVDIIGTHHRNGKVPQPSYGALHVSGAGRQTKKGMDTDKINS